MDGKLFKAILIGFAILAMLGRMARSSHTYNQGQTYNYEINESNNF